MNSAVGNLKFVGAAIAILVLGACSQDEEAVWERTAGAAPAAPASSTAPDILVIVIDTLRPDHLSCFGYDRETSPFLCRWADGAARYENAYTHGTHTLIAMASLFSGTLPTVHRVRHVPDSLTSQATDGLTASLEGWSMNVFAAGYETWGLSSNPYVSRDFGFTQGFTRFWHTDSRDGAHLLELFLGTWEAREETSPERPLFAYLHFMDPHNPYEPPASFRDSFRVPQGESVYNNGKVEVSERDLAYTMALYDAEILYLDGLLERLLAAWEGGGSRPRATVVLSDHGDEFQEHGGMGHGRTVYEELARTLLLVKGPGVAPGRYLEPVAHVDVHRLVLDWADAAVPDTARGRPRAAWGSGSPLLYTESLLERAALRVGTKTLVFPRDQNGDAYYYERANDPHELVPLRDEPTLGVLLETLREVTRGDGALGDRLGTPARSIPTDGSVDELRALGYLED